MAGSLTPGESRAQTAPTGPSQHATPHARVAQLIRDASRVVALTGAGISVPSGIPDFRSPGTGLWQNVNPMEVAHIDAWRRDPAEFWRFYGDRFASLHDKRPNDAHEALASMVDAVITQNVDRLHRLAGAGPFADPLAEMAFELVEVHGSIDTSSCLSCGDRATLEQTRDRLAAAPDGVPRCAAEGCDEPLKPDVVLFGEMLDETALRRAGELCASADVLLCVGSSLEVFPVAQLPSLTLRNGGAVVVVTAGETQYDDVAEVKLSGDVVDELDAVLAAL